MYYSEDDIKAVTSSINIREYIEQFIPLEKHGKKWFGLCPFHTEKSPSFMVDEEKQIFYCFGCGKGGNVITFTMEYFQIAFEAAVRKLGFGKEGTSENKSTKKDQLLELNKTAEEVFGEQLTMNTDAINYICKRILAPETIDQFRIGYADESQTHLYDILKEKGFDDNIMKESGLFNFYEDGKVYNKFSNRLIFPIQNINGNIIGFGGRILIQDPKKETKKVGPKYLNSPETEIFDKSSNLFGLNFAKESNADYFILCEGYMDVIAMHQAGFTNAIASLGTALTERQADLIKRFKNKVILSYDSDGPGVTAARRAIPILMARNIELRFLDLNPYKDPDEFIKANGVAAFQKRIDEARTLKQWTVKQALKSGENDQLEKYF